MDSKSKISAISGYYGFENFGDEAILKVLTSELKNQGHSLTVFSKSPIVTSAKLGVNSIYTFDIPKLIGFIKNADVLISGGGSLLQDATSIKSLLYYLFVIAVALFYKKDVIIFAQGIGPLKNFIGRLLTKMLLKRCKYITVRDEKSLFLLRGWKLNPELVSDPVWNIDIKESVSMKRIGIQLRSWKGLSQKYLMALAREVATSFADFEIYIYSFQEALDLSLCNHFEAQLKLVNPNLKTKVLNNLTIDETIQSFANIDYLIGMRYHACLLALKYGIPTLALSYDIKVDKIAQRFGLPCSHLDASENISALITEMKNLNRTELRNKASSCRFDFSNVIKAIDN